MNRAFILLASCLSLCACDPNANTTTEAISTPSPTATSIADLTLMDEKAMYGAEVLYNVPANAYVIADAGNLLKPEVKATIKPKLIKLYDYLKLARLAYAAGNSIEFAQHKNNMTSLRDDLCGQLGNCTDER